MYFSQSLTIAFIALLGSALAAPNAARPPPPPSRPAPPAINHANQQISCGNSAEPYCCDPAPSSNDLVSASSNPTCNPLQYNSDGSINCSVEIVCCANNGSGSQTCSNGAIIAVGNH